MTPTPGADVREAAARAAVGVPGVAALQPVLADRLAAAAVRVRRGVGADPRPAAPGVRVEPDSGSGWHVEVRCIVHEGGRVVDVARQVREEVRAAVSTHLIREGSPGPVTVRVTVTRTLAGA
ncbi:Asp23/Gls24 family envelope stress response protein [Streptomyces sp. NPDC005409]|uniref:Asp23/Gls24 family envelope stress response protein n=1 Tax=Streptomyces sp. NPDC005409 TaxID=3155342 RepID=UPI0034553ADE